MRSGSPRPGTPPHIAGGRVKPAAVQSNEQWTMRLNSQGLPICRDLHGLFTTVIISLCDRWPDWRYLLAFVLPAVIQRMQALQFVQIVRDSANGLPNMLSLSQTKTSFTMNSETAEKICQAFLDACLLMPAPDSEPGVYTPSPKGLHLIDRFVTRHGIATRSVSNLLNMHTPCDKLLFLERDDQDDVLLSDAIVRIVFHRMVGQTPAHRDAPSALGMELEPAHAQDASGNMYETGRFSSFHALSWLVNFTTLTSVDEAIVLAAHMVRLGWFEPERKMPPAMSNRVATVSVDAALRADGSASEGTFIEGEVYHLTELGASTAWHLDWVEQPLETATAQRPPTSFFNSRQQRQSEMRSVSPRLDEFEMYGDYVHTGRSPTPTKFSMTAPEAETWSSAVAAAEAAEATPQPPLARASEPPAHEHRPVVQRSLDEVLRDAPLRQSLYAFLERTDAAQPLVFWCEAEWFRADVRRATDGTLADALRVDAVATLPSEDAAPRVAPSAPSVSAPMRRAAQHARITQAARTRIARFFAQPQALGLPAAALSQLREAFEAYDVLATPATPTPADARTHELALAKLLKACAAAQKHAHACLADAHSARGDSVPS